MTDWSTVGAPGTAREEHSVGAPSVHEMEAARERFVCLDEIRKAAKTCLPRLVWEFLLSGSGNEDTLRANEAAFAQWCFRPRVLTGASIPDTRCEFMGVPLAAPLLTAPFGVDALFHPSGQKAVMVATRAAGIAGIAPEAGSFPLEELHSAAPTAARFFQLHPSDPDTMSWLAKRAEDAGYHGLCVTVDQPVLGWREVNWANRFSFDPSLVEGNFRDAGGPDVRRAFGAIHGGARYPWTWNELGTALAEVHLPFAVKGVLTAEDACAAIDIGAAAVVVSNHGGRQLHSAPASLHQLPEVVEAVAGRAQVALDSGVRRGSDVVKAVALGADVVLLGRIAAFGLAADGEVGVLRTLELLVEEITVVLSLLGCASVGDLNRTHLQPAGEGQLNARGGGDSDGARASSLSRRL